MTCGCESQSSKLLFKIKRNDRANSARELAGVALMARGHAKDKKKPARSRSVPALSVLVIDDSPAFLRSLVRVLKIYGLNVAVARDGRAGLATFRRISPAVVLTDMLMPLNGIKTIPAMRRERPGVKIIAMSGGDGVGKSDALAIAKQLGADSVVQKPFDIGEVVAMIRRYLKSGG